MRGLARELREEAERANERRLLVVSGEPEATRERAARALDAAEVDPARATYVGPAAFAHGRRIDAERTDRLLGTTQSAVVLDCHEGCRPNALGRAVGAVDGGGLLVLLAPPLEEWPTRRDGFDETLAVPPFAIEDVAGNFRRRLVRTLRQHPGVAVVEVTNDGEEEIRRTGLTDPTPPQACARPAAPAGADFPTAVYAACRTADQADAVAAFEDVVDGHHAIVLEADRGRGKSAAAGLAAAALALDGRDVLVTVPAYRNAQEVFARAEALLVEVGELAGRDADEEPRVLETETGRIRFEPPAAAVELPDDPDVVVVDEAAALPVRRLERFLAADAVAFATTIHGYEGAGRGFSVRFRERLADGDHAISEVRLDEPIRYAAGDPVEVWSFRALALDARLAAEQVVADATPVTADYRAIAPADLLADGTLLREAFGLLVLAHYRTEPDDLARVLDAPNVSVRALLHEDHVVAVALLAREGDLPADLGSRMYEGHRVRGNMLPDVLTSQLRDEDAGRLVGQRVMRIATHPAVRSRGLGSKLLEEIRAEFAADVDWLGTGYGATPELLSFWRANGYATIHLSTSRNDASGEHSAIMLDACSPAGERLLDRHTDRFLRRVPSMLADPLRELDPDVVRNALRSVAGTPDLALTDVEWRHLVGLSEGAAIFDTAPRPSRRLALRHLAAPADPEALTDREERLLVAKALQARGWSSVADDLGFESRSTCMRAFGSAVEPLVDAYGGAVARDERRRFE